jgi:hypothetical protein
MVAISTLRAAGGASFRDRGDADEREQRRFNEHFRLRDDLRWVDLYTPSDPVPNGPLVRSLLQPPANFDSVAIQNRASAVLDHTSYWHNYEQFVSRVARELLDLSKRDGDRVPSAEVYSKLATERDARVSALRRGRWIAVGAALLLAWARWSDLLAYSAAAWPPAMEMLEKIPAVGRYLTGVSAHSDGNLDRLGAALLGGAGAVAAYSMTLLFWLFWDAGACKKRFITRDTGEVLLSRHVFNFFLAFLAALALWQVADVSIAGFMLAR